MDAYAALQRLRSADETYAFFNGELRSYARIRWLPWNSREMFAVRSALLTMIAKGIRGEDGITRRQIVALCGVIGRINTSTANKAFVSPEKQPAIAAAAKWLRVPWWKFWQKRDKNDPRTYREAEARLHQLLDRYQRIG